MELRHLRPGGRLRTAAVAVTVAAVALLLGACGDDGGPAATDGPPQGTVTVLAAASLTDVVTELAEAFEDEHRGVEVRLSFGGSSSLREQVLDGAPADVYLSADRSNVDVLVEEGAARPPADLATNDLMIAVPRGNPARITGLADFAEPGHLLGLCADPVPCGRLAREALARAGVTASVDTNEPDVRSLLTKVRAGELDAGIVYRTDVLAADGAVEGIELPEPHRVTTSYPIAVLTEAPNPVAAEAFVAFVRGPAGRSLLEDHGFRPR